MGQPALNRFERSFGDGGMCPVIRVADLQTDDILSARLEREDSVRHGNGGRLPDEFELGVEIHGMSAVENFRIIPRAGVWFSGLIECRKQGGAFFRQYWIQQYLPICLGTFRKKAFLPLTLIPVRKL